MLFSREGGPQGLAGARILKEDSGTPGLLGLALVGDIRALTFVSQGTELQAQHGAYRVEAVSEDGRRITKVAPVASAAGGVAVTPKEVGRARKERIKREGEGEGGLHSLRSQNKSCQTINP